MMFYLVEILTNITIQKLIFLSKNDNIRDNYLAWDEYKHPRFCSKR
uniref:Uncharacterized protein n=1 Tax=Arundo donax TaxID=35708 RepID=A0A0A8ZH35_ARUDO